VLEDVEPVSAPGKRVFRHPAPSLPKKYSHPYQVRGGRGDQSIEIAKISTASKVEAEQPHLYSDGRDGRTPNVSGLNRRRRRGLARSYRLDDQDITDLQGAVALADARGTPMNLGVTINWPTGQDDLQRPMDKFKTLSKPLRSQFRRWGIELTYIVVHEAGQSEHTHILLHLPDNKGVTHQMVRTAIRRMVGVGPRNKKAVDADTYDVGWAVYLAKGCGDESRKRADIPEEWPEEQGCIVGKRLQTSRSLNRQSQKAHPDLDAAGFWENTAVKLAKEALARKKNPRRPRDRQPGDFARWVGRMNDALTIGHEQTPPPPPFLTNQAPDSIATIP
jgi:hypothetical protein